MKISLRASLIGTLSILAAMNTVTAFTIVVGGGSGGFPSPLFPRGRVVTRLFGKKSGKGFGNGGGGKKKKNNSNPRPQRKQQQQSLERTVASSQVSAVTPASFLDSELSPSTIVTDPTAVPPPIDELTAPLPNSGGGRETLARLRRAEVEKRDLELRKVRDLQLLDTELSQDATGGVIPEKVAQKMLGRMLPFVGIPLFGGIGVFIGFWYFATYKNVEFQPALVAFTTIGILGISLAGISYSVISASWDSDKSGSALGVDEFRKNVGNIKDGLSRSKENALLRDRMEGMPENEIKRAVKDMDRRDEKSRKEKLSLRERRDEDMN